MVRPEEIAFDVDGVFADTFRTFVDTARSEFGCDFSYEDITEYDYSTVIEIEEQAGEEIITRILEDPVGIGIRPMTGAAEVLTRLAGIAPLLFVTARPEEKAIRGWILRHLPGVPGSAVRVAATGTGENKRSVLLDHHISCFVEDCLETAFLLEPHGVRPVIFDQPWNRKPHPFHVVRSWQQIDALVDWPRA
jgi:hypothetical protein